MSHGREEGLGAPKYDKEVSQNHIPLLTNGTDVCFDAFIFVYSTVMQIIYLCHNWCTKTPFLSGLQVSGELSAASPGRLSMASPPPGGGGKRKLLLLYK